MNLKIVSKLRAVIKNRFLLAWSFLLCLTMQAYGASDVDPSAPLEVIQQGKEQAKSIFPIAHLFTLVFIIAIIVLFVLLIIKIINRKKHK